MQSVARSRATVKTHPRTSHAPSATNVPYRKSVPCGPFAPGLVAVSSPRLVWPWWPFVTQAVLIAHRGELSDENEVEPRLEDADLQDEHNLGNSKPKESSKDA